jgi:hypothetical protein
MSTTATLCFDNGNQALSEKLMLVLLLEILQVKKPEKLISINSYIC